MIYPSPLPSQGTGTAQVRRVLTSRPGGVSSAPYDTFNLGLHVGDDRAHVEANRARLADQLELNIGSVTWMNQVHGDQVRVIGLPAGTTARQSARGEPPVCDAVVSATPGVALAVLVADCVPVLLADPDAGVIGAAHAGREGVRRHVVSRTIEAMVELGARRQRIDALLGPAICGQCYEVSAELADQVEAAAPGGRGHSPGGAPTLDLRAALAVELGRLGVSEVVSDPRCTAEDQTLFSYRRDGVTGRQAGVVWLS